MTGSYHLVTELRPVSMLDMAEQISATSGMSVQLGCRNRLFVEMTANRYINKLLAGITSTM
jgi:hypothetical protein